jgi:hypothetical protein
LPMTDSPIALVGHSFFELRKLTERGRGCPCYVARP